ncbi:MAG: hypothetical protein RBS56_02515 [Candidatus Gracilibacteria bacterium]|jgi:hypothetical protein|nr:hypothetical protein [Candidatus Gracilibacteria bacterium]
MNKYEGFEVSADSALSLLSGLKDLSEVERAKISALVSEIFEGRSHKGLSEEKLSFERRVKNEFLKLIYGFVFTEEELFGIVSKFAFENRLIIVQGEADSEIEDSLLIKASCLSEDPDFCDVFCFQIDVERRLIFVYKKFVNEDNTITYLPYYL